MNRQCGLYARVSTEMQANKLNSSIDTQVGHYSAHIKSPLFAHIKSPSPFFERTPTNDNFF